MELEGGVLRTRSRVVEGRVTAAPASSCSIWGKLAEAIPLTYLLPQRWNLQLCPLRLLI